MSEQENIQLVRQTYQQISTGDIPTFLKLLHAEVEWRVPRMEGVPFAGTWKGRDGVAQFFAKVAAVQEILEFQPKEFIAQGEKVVVLGRFVMRIRATGNEVASDWAHVWTLQHGEILGFYEYVDTAAVTRAHAAAASHP